MRSITLLSALLLAGAAHAAEVTLYKQANFGGSQLTLRGHTPNLANTGFYDQASSLVVHSGRWEFCSQPDFRGDCVTLNRGEYATLDPRLNHRIESAREVGSYAGQIGSYGSFVRGSIELYGQPGFGGRTLMLDRDTPTLENTGFDDRASSIVVREGTWQLCADPGYSGSCRIYAPGRYADLGYGMAKQVTSARLLRSRRDAPAELSGGVFGPDSGPIDGRSRVILFSQNNFGGESIAVAGVNGTLDRMDFDDSAASMLIEGGRWVFCTEEYFRGDCKEIGPGRYPNLREVGLRRSISSIRPAGSTSPVARRAENVDIQLFEGLNFEGRAFATQRDVPNLAPTDFNDKTSSVVVSEGRWELCNNSGYDGQCVVVGPGRYASLGGLNNQISSLRRVR